MAVLAGMEFLVFGAALCLISLPHFDGETPLLDRPLSEVLTRALLYAPVLSISMAATGLYNERQVLTLGGLLTRLMVSSIGGMMVIALVSALCPDLAFGREALSLGAIVVIAGSAGCHYIVGKLAGEQLFKQRILVYGAGRRAASLMQKQADDTLGAFKAIGFIPAVGDEPSAISTERRVELHGSSLLEYCHGHGVAEIVVAMDDPRAGFPFEAFLECRLAGIAVTDLTEFLESETGQVRIDLVHANWMVFSNGFQRNSLQSHLERLVDVAASLTLLALTWPIMLLTVIAIKAEDGPLAPVLYAQVRVGERGQPFQLFKFRSMREDAERDGARWAAANDDRVTRVGRVIRKLRIDELPQIVNVLNAQMSLVGPRPERPEFVSQLNTKIPLYRERHTIKPGITGWAQLCYPYGSNERDATEKLQYDLFYVKNRTLLFYLAILVQTVEVILWGKGAR
jgi:sugar transferase (PEP-CTERM system associated)